MSHSFSLAIDFPNPWNLIPSIVRKFSSGLALFLNLIISNLMISEEQIKIEGKITIKTNEDRYFL
jgi:hypothetical protein